MKKLKRTLLTVLVAIAVIFGSYFFLSRYLNTYFQGVNPKNEMVMYGFKDYDDYQKNQSDEYKKIDNEFVDYVKRGIESGKTQADGINNIQDAAQYACNTGSDYQNQGDIKTAIKRYNQAWLLDHNHPCVYANYGYYYAFAEKDLEKSFEMYEKALGLSDQKNSWWILTDYSEVLDACYALDNTRIDCLDKAYNNLQKSLKIQDTPKTHRALAFVYYHKNDYVKSWEQVRLAIDGGVPQKVMQRFIDDLKKKMPDPKGLY